MYTEKKKVSLGLTVGILFLPIIFSWFTLKKKYTTKTKILSFVWLGFFLIIGRANTDDKSKQQAKSVSTKLTTYKLGEPFRLGDFQYVIEKVKKTSWIGNRLINEKASDGAMFLIVTYTIENLGKETETILTDDFRIVDSKNRIFKTSSNATSTLAMTQKNKEFLLSELQPGLKKKTSTAFELPITAIQNGIKLVIPEKGIFSTSKIEIALYEPKSTANAR